jgi:hypothetical protein
MGRAFVDGLLRPLGLERFVRGNYLREPYGCAGTAAALRELVGWRVLDEICDSGHPDCWLPRDGKLPAEAPLRAGRLSAAEARAGFAAGRTVLVRHAERAHPIFAEVVRAFAETFGKPIDIQLYCTPAGERGFSWHYDLEEVFVIQCAGHKEFELRQNTVVRRPLPVPLPKDLGYEKERSPLRFACSVSAGDVLYIPSGFWHQARATSDCSFHASVGVMALPRS